MKKQVKIFQTKKEADKEVSRLIEKDIQETGTHQRRYIVRYTPEEEYRILAEEY